MDRDERKLKKIFAKNLIALREGKGLSPTQLADRLSLGKSTISEWESGNKLARAGNLEKLSAFFGVPKSAFYAENDDRYLSYEKSLRLPIVGRISCGNGAIAYEDIEGHEPTPQAWLNGGEYFYLRAKGDSMSGAGINDGALLLIRKQPDVEDGEIAAVLVGDEAFLKKVYKTDNKLVLQSENPKYPVIICDPREQQCLIIGRLRKIITTI